MVPARTPARHARVAQKRSVRPASTAVLTVRSAAVAALVGAALALVGRSGGLAATIGTTVLGVGALTVWLAVAVTVFRVARDSRRDNGGPELAVVEEGTSTAAHRASRPRPRAPWYVGVEVSFDLAA